MCIGIPMQVIEPGECFARCRGRNGESVLDMRLIGSQPEGAWVLAFADAARETLDTDRAAAINAALDALEGVLSGETSAAMIDAFFPDLARGEPELPDFLKPG
ncbi:MAG: HypC/HybG/HupF family hydrogenase formation chaperone [Zoogloeaceae bacterium]|jgi:hydrogenase expression/formation protein HypC|nr:HypC/HybG/HupF family hydrogenase formation chaperone [Zoogloeaceae bacterium]